MTTVDCGAVNMILRVLHTLGKSFGYKSYIFVLLVYMSNERKKRFFFLGGGGVVNF